MDRFREMEAFIAVVETGSFVKAADRLHISKTATSRLVQDVEARLGVRLLHRTTRRLSLTEAGRDYFTRGKQVLADLEEAEGMISLAADKAAGLLRVNAPVSFGIQHLAPLWGAFMASHAEIEVDVTLNDRVVDLLEEGYDMAVRIARLPDSSLVFRRLATTRLVLCASPGYLARHGRPNTLADLTRHQVIGYSYAPSGDTLTLYANKVAQSVLTRPRFHANNGDTCRAAALEDQGIVLQPDFLVGRDIVEGRLIRVLPDLQGDEIGIYAVYPSRKHLSGKVRALVEFLLEAFAKPDWQA